MVFGIHLWKIKDVSIKEQFQRDWSRVTVEVAKPAGNRFAKLFLLPKSILVSITIWNTKEGWSIWKEGMKELPERALYRKYKMRESLTIKIGK